MPVMAYALLDSDVLLAALSRNFADKLLAGIAAERDAASFVEQPLAMSTVPTPEIGYDRAAARVKEASSTGRSARDVAREESGIAPDRLNRIWDPFYQI